VQTRINQTGDELEKLVGTRTRQINRRLKSVAELPAADAQKLLDGVTFEEDT
jgi:DNA recombination protein RmuC